MAKPDYKDAESEKIHLDYFSGGTSVDYKLGIPNSFYYSENLDFRTYPSQLSVQPGLSTVATTPDLITAMDQDLKGVRWGIGTAGSLYQISTNDTFSVEATLPENGSAGILYNQITDQLYIPGQTGVSLYGQVTTGAPDNPVFRPNQFGKSASVDPGCANLFDPTQGYYSGAFRNNGPGLAVGITNPNQVSSTTATGTYTLPESLSEVPGTYCYFAPDIEPFYSIAVYAVAVGTGNWTLTLHDSLNNTLASVTILNANLVSNGWNEFVFGSQVRALVQQSQTGGSATYHFHLISSANNGTVAVVPVGGGLGATGQLDSVNFLLFAYRLAQTNNGWHPTTIFQNLLCIGNGRYLSTYDFSNDSQPTNTQWNRHELVFKAGYEVCGLSTNNQYLVIALERRSNDPTRNAQDGQLMFWDGTTQNPNIVIDIPMGSPYGLTTFNSVTYFICGGSLFAWSGGQTVLKVRKLSYQNTNYLGAVDSTIVNPNMMAIRYNLLEVGYPSSTTNSNLDYGLYEWGAVELQYPNSLGLSYTLANGFLNNGGSISGLQIGSVYNFVDHMYVSWSYVDSNSVTHYGVDVLNNSSLPATGFNFQSLIYDNGLSYKQKIALRMQITFLPLPSGYTLQAQYSVNRGPWVLSSPASVGESKLVFEIDPQPMRFHELQWGFVGSSSGATQPLIVTGVTMEINPAPEETDMTPNTT